jgi:hypothetical protein
MQARSVCLAFEIELRIQPMPPTRRLPLRCVAGQHVNTTIPVANTTDATMDCIVTLSGPHVAELRAPVTLRVDPQSTVRVDAFRL